MPYQVSILDWDSRLCLCYCWISSETHDEWFWNRLIYLKAHTPYWLTIKMIGSIVYDTGDAQRRSMCSVRLLRSDESDRGLDLPPERQHVSNKIVKSLMTIQSQRIVFDKTAKTWVSESCRSNDIFLLAYAVFHALCAGSSAFLDNYPNKKEGEGLYLLWFDILTLTHTPSPSHPWRGSLPSFVVKYFPPMKSHTHSRDGNSVLRWLILNTDRFLSIHWEIIFPFLSGTFTRRENDRE